MRKYRKYHSKPLSFNRKAVGASASVTRAKNTIHALTEIDITTSRHLIRKHFEKTGVKLSLTAYVVASLAKAMKNHPDFNSFIKGNRLIVLTDLTISVLIEKDIDGEKVPEPIGIKRAQLKSLQEINGEIKEARKKQTAQLGSFPGQTWIRWIPGFLLKCFVRIADKNINMAVCYGKVAVTAVGMFSKEAVWFIPHGSATVLITVGSIMQKVVEIKGQHENREHLCITASFDHDIVDGVPAARFMNELAEVVKSGRIIHRDLGIS